MLPDNKMIIDCGLDVKSDEYQEPYQALKCAPYFSHSTVLLEMKDFIKDSNTALSGIETLARIRTSVRRVPGALPGAPPVCALLQSQHRVAGDKGLR